MKHLRIIFIVITVMALQFYASIAMAYSGMAKVGDNAYLIVHDVKSDEKGNRLGLLTLGKDKSPKYTKVIIKNWKHSDGAASDLESICKLPGKTDEFLIAESGYWNEKFGRIFHIRLKKKRKQAIVLNIFHLPKIIGSSEKIDGDNFEGMTCFQKQQSIYVVLGERGGSATYRDSFLRIGILDLNNNSLSWEKFKNTPIKISAPGKWNDARKMHSISDLYTDNNGIVWSVATQDPGDQGPFRSIIYQAATVIDPKDNRPLKALNNSKIYWTIDGLKVESLSAPTKIVPNSFMSIGTEDENYQGVWRPLFKPLD